MNESSSKESSAELPQIPISTHFYKQRYLYAFAPQAEVVQHIRTQALEQESSMQTQILQSWEQLQSRVATMLASEIGVAESIQLTAIPSEYEAVLQQYASNPLFQRTFAGLPTGFGIVEIDKLVAAQRTVNLDYVDRLVQSFPKSPQMADLLNICVAPTRAMDPIQHLEVGPNVHVFSSPNSDIRFLGSFKKNLTPDDLDYAIMGGIPAAAIITFVGYGAAPINVLQAGSRVVLNNGFHRVYALRSMGVTHIPVVIQVVRNPALEFPPAVAGLPKEYLLGAPRPVLMKDFFEVDFAITLRVRERIKVVTVGTNVGQHEVPS